MRSTTGDSAVGSRRGHLGRHSHGASGLLRISLVKTRPSVGQVWKPGEIRSKMFRHTYCAARLQTLDQGAPVSVFTVARGMGHGGEAMVRRVYGHLGQVRHRAEGVEYRIEQHAAKLGVRLEALHGVRFDTTIGTTA